MFMMWNYLKYYFKTRVISTQDGKIILIFRYDFSVLNKVIK